MLFAAALCSLLITFPHASIRPSLPYKVELLTAVIGIAFAAWMFSKYRRSQSAGTVRIEGIGTGILAFTIFGLSSFLWAASLSGVIHHSLVWLIYACVFLAFANRSPINNGVDFALRLFVAITVILGVFAVIDHLSAVEFAFNEGTIRIRYGKYAEMLITYLPLFWAAAIWTRDRRTRLLYIATGLFGWLTVMLSLSRGAFIAGIAGMALFFGLMMLLGGKRPRRAALAMAVIWLILTAGAQLSFTLFSTLPSTAEYISGSVDPSNTNVEMRRLTWRIAYIMFRENAALGVGADNFGINVTESRRVFRTESPESPPADIAEDYLIERAHNEFLQILAELGIAGLILFCVPFVLLKIEFLRHLRRRNWRITPFVAAAIGGMTAFAVSSLASSFSFRSIQNGVVFFIIFGLLARRIAGKTTGGRLMPATVLPAAIAVTSMLLFFYSLRLAAAEYCVFQAERSEPADSERLFKYALFFDDDYAGAYYLLAGREASAGRYASAVDNFTQAAKHGIATSDTFVQLAKAHLAEGNFDAAKSTFTYGLSVYPRSIYLRSAFVLLLEKNGHFDEAKVQEKEAISIDGPQARGWLLLLREGGNAAFRAAEKHPEIAKPADLRPASAVPQYVEPIPYQ